MTPTLNGRLQTRLFLLVTVGVLWTLIVQPFLPGVDQMSDTAAVYRVLVGTLAIVAIVGCLVWEPIYHLVQQWRWEKDWPILYGLLQGIPEGLVAFVIARQLFDVVPPSTFAVHFATTWILVWLVANGPMRVLSLRWRYRGGRIL